MTDDKNPWCYIGRRPTCNCIVAAAVDLPEYAKETRKSVSEWMRDGLIIGRMRVVDVRQQFGCDHEKLGPKRHRSTPQEQGALSL